MTLLEIVKQIDQSKGVQFSGTRIPKVDKSKADKLYKVYKYVLENFRDKIKLEDVSKIADMTIPSFCRFFKNKTNKTFTSFVNEIRIEKACELLSKDDIEIAEISSLCGFNNFTSFNKNFKKITASTPSSYRSFLNSAKQQPLKS